MKKKTTQVSLPIELDPRVLEIINDDDIFTDFNDDVDIKEKYESAIEP